MRIQSRPILQRLTAGSVSVFFRIQRGYDAAERERCDDASVMARWKTHGGQGESVSGVLSLSISAIAFERGCADE